jgi:hypothetical protein
MRSSSVFALVLLLSLTACKVNYSFTGASISPDVKTITIDYFQNKATLVIPTLSRDLTEALRDYFTSQTSLTLMERGGDLVLEGSITVYEAGKPVAIQGNEQAAMNRMTITVNVKFTNRKNEKQNYEQTFSRYQDYPSSQPLSAVQNQLIDDINRMLVDDIFKKSVVNW